MKTLLLFFVSSACFAQSWQWAASGGTNVPITDYLYGPERVRSLTVDNQGNTYFLSTVSYSNLQVDGNPKNLFSTTDPTTDGLLASFSCDGTYRWSKVIGGYQNDEISGLGVDNDGNVYISGTITPISLNETNIQYTHFDNDTILPTSYFSENTYKKNIFLAKYNTNGELQWLKMPQKDDVSWLESISQYYSREVSMGVDGSVYWACFLGPGVHCDGNLTVANGGMYVLHYDSAGNFMDGTLIDMQPFGTPVRNSIFKRSPVTGNFYTGGTLYLNDGDSLTVGGNSVTNSLFVAAFNPQGEFLWVKTNTGNPIWGGGYSGMIIDEEDNVYFNSTVFTQGSEIGSPIDGWNGQPFETNNVPFPFLVKMDILGNTVWKTNASAGSSFSLTAALNNSEVAVGLGARNLTWQNMVYNYPGESVSGNHPLMVRFNKETGSIIGYTGILSTGASLEYITSIAYDQLGGCYIGGSFTSQLTAGETVTCSGGEADFFLAKYGTADCDFMGVDAPVKESLQGWPNPVIDILRLNNIENMAFTVFDAMGKKIMAGNIEAMGSLDCRGLAKGIYLVVLDGTARKSLKIVKE